MAFLYLLSHHLNFCFSLSHVMSYSLYITYWFSWIKKVSQELWYMKECDDKNNKKSIYAFTESTSHDIYMHTLILKT